MVDERITRVAVLASHPLHPLNPFPMSRPIAIVGAPSSIGTRPYDEGGMRRLDLEPGVLRAYGLVPLLRARDLGVVAHLDHLAELLAPLARHPKSVGLEVTIYDPKLDPDRASEARLVTLLERGLGG